MQNPEILAQQLEATNAYKVLRKFTSHNGFALPPTDLSATKLAMIIDTETTSLDKSQGKIIEIGYTVVRFCPKNATLYEIVTRYSGLQDPGHPLSDETKEITGISDEDLAGQVFDMDRIRADVEMSDILIAHNAPFDRGYLELLDSCFKKKWWACSQREFLWSALRTGSSKLEFLAYKVAGLFYDAHRALVDTEVLLEILSKKAHDQQTVFSHVLTSARKQTYRVWATNSPFEKKDDLKKRGYQWSDGTTETHPIKAWYKEGVSDLQSEIDWLMTVYEKGGGVIVDKQTGRERYTPRFVAQERIAVPPLSSVAS